MTSEKYKRHSMLISDTVSFAACFTVWMMLVAVGIPVREELGLTGIQFSILTALPVLSGSLIRVPLGIWTDKYDGQTVTLILVMVSAPAILLIGYTYAYWHFLLIGLMMGLVGDTLSVDMLCVTRWFPEEQQGLAVGMFGAGNAGGAVNKSLTPALIIYDTQYFAPAAYTAIMLGTALLFWLTSYHGSRRLASSSISLKEQFTLLKDPGMLRCNQYHSVVFGGYVALALQVTHYYASECGLNLKTIVLLAACFSLPGGVLRAFGGYLSNRFGVYHVIWMVMWVL